MSEHESDSEFLRWIAKRCRSRAEAVGLGEGVFDEMLTLDAKRLEELADRLEGRCKTCKWWTVDESGSLTYHPHRLCANIDKIGPKAREDGSDTLTYPWDDGGRMSSGPKFGCIHYEPRNAD